MQKTASLTSGPAFDRDIRVARSRALRTLELGLLALGVVLAAGCGSNGGSQVVCLVQSDIQLRFPGGSSSIAAVTATGGCMVDPPPIDCQSEVVPCGSPGACACDVPVGITQQLTPPSACMIEATSTTGASFKIDVPLQQDHGACGVEGVRLVDPNQATITVDFSPDGGTADGAAD